MEFCRVKEEPEDDSQALRSLPGVSRTRQLPIHTSVTPSITYSGAPGEDVSPPPFPRALYQVGCHRETPTPHRPSAMTTGPSTYRMPPGPNPVLGTPQHRFRGLVGAPAEQGRNRRLGFPIEHSRLTSPNTNPIAAPTAPRSISGGAVAQFPGVVALLSRECQRRGFNPKWELNEVNDGFACDVWLLDQRVTGDRRTFPSAQEAKRAIAPRALAVVRSWPVDRHKNTQDLEQKGSTRAGHQSQMEPFRNGQNIPARKRDEDATKTAVGNSGATAAAVVTAPGPRRQSVERAREEAELLDRVRRLGIPLPDTESTNLDATQAFIQGLALGARLAESGPSRPRHSGSLSPAARRGRDSRSRSPRGAHGPEINYRDRDRYWPPRRLDPHDTYRPSYLGPSEGHWPHDRHQH
ncbi:hypothetical protein C8A03DRAFT_30022 [Achaetomium macrosporum]|uniref:Uncharacterized protein n=1 Tax=Achaetomium macrosporum TaxID=79813 RepID=A0AAN7CJA1_9PEZI|nr:hypothetical protein C8A03DRAFT_30022 [Achaetomium macrosporum]